MALPQRSILYDIYTDYIYTLCLKQRCEILTARNSAESPPRNCNNRWQHLTGWRMSFWQKRTSKESDQSVIRSHAPDHLRRRSEQRQCQPHAFRDFLRGNYRRFACGVPSKLIPGVVHPEF